MKKVYRPFLSLFTFLSLFLQAKIAYADICPPGDFANLCAFKPAKLGGVAGNIISGLIILAIILTLFYLIYGGIKYITSGGDKAKIDAARSHIRAAILGLVIALLAFAILNIVTYVFLGRSFTNFTLPTLLD